MHKVSIALNIPDDHPAFPGHFPGRPIVPGVVLLDVALKAMAQHIGVSLAGCRLDTVKFLHPVGPRQSLALEFEQLPGGNLRFDIRTPAHRVATGSLRFPELAP